MRLRRSIGLFLRNGYSRVPRLPPHGERGRVAHPRKDLRPGRGRHGGASAPHPGTRGRHRASARSLGRGVTTDPRAYGLRRGQILSFRLRGETVYGLAPFVVGIFTSLQLPRMDAELAALVEEYAPHLLGTVGGVRPALARVIPVNARLTRRR